MRLKDKIAIVVGAGQSPGEGMGNGRATVLRFAEEGARVLAVDNNIRSAEETVAMAQVRGGECAAFEADVCNDKDTGRNGGCGPETMGTDRYPALQCWSEHRRGRHPAG